MDWTQALREAVAHDEESWTQPPKSVLLADPIRDRLDETSVIDAHLAWAISHADEALPRDAICAALQRRWGFPVEIPDYDWEPAPILVADAAFPSAAIRINLAGLRRLAESEHRLRRADDLVAHMHGRLEMLGPEPKFSPLGTGKEGRAEKKKAAKIWRAWSSRVTSSSLDLTELWDEEAACQAKKRFDVVDWASVARDEIRLPGLQAFLTPALQPDSNAEEGAGSDPDCVCVSPKHRHFRGRPYKNVRHDLAIRDIAVEHLRVWWFAHEQDTEPVFRRMFDLYGWRLEYVASRTLTRYLPALAHEGRRRAVGIQNITKVSPNAFDPGYLLRCLALRLLDDRGEPTDPLLTCPFCQVVFPVSALTDDQIRRYGPPRWCPDCLRTAAQHLKTNGRSDGKWTQQTAGAWLRDHFQATQRLPQPQDLVSEDVGGDPLDVPSELTRDAWLISHAAAPTLEAIHSLWPGGWSAVLLGAGVTEGVRASRGLITVARDGHLCRSMLERHVDDWFTSQGIEHTCEPPWPADPEHNPFGRKRADWLLPGGLFVEMAGMLSKPEYAKKMEAKRAFAAAAGCRLLVLTPADVTRLHELVLPLLPR